MNELRRAAARLTVIGDVGLDLVMGPVPGWPAIGTETIVPGSEMRLGGSAGNTFLAMRSVGAECRLLSKVGSDLFGEWLARQVEALGGALGNVDSPTSVTTGIIHDCGERSFFTTKGHLEQMSWENLCDLLEDPGEGEIALLTGVFLLPKLRLAYPALLSELRRRGYRIAIDTGWPSGGWTAAIRDEVSGWLGHCDHVLLNEAELTGLAGESDVGRAMRAIGAHLRPDATLVVKVGPEGAVGVQRGSTCSAPAPKVVSFDTIGAGDSFNAGYLHARLLGHDLSTSLHSGCTVASRIISHSPRQAIRPGEFASAVR